MEKRTLKHFFEQYAAGILLGVAGAASAAMFWWSYQHGFAIAYGDAASHLNIARRAIDGLTPGAAQFGSVWLPLHHFLILFFVWSDFLWQTGLAGGIISGLAFLGTVYVIFRLVKLLTGDPTAAFFAGLVVISNPNFLYLQTTPMGESLFLFVLSASAYALTRFCLSGSVGNLIVAAAFGLLSTQIRYEGWFFIAAELLVVFWFAYRQGGWRRAEGLTLAFGFLAGLGPILWFLWNLTIFGDPFYFLSGDFSARAQQAVFQAQGLLPTAHNFSLSLKYYLLSVGENNGFLLGWLTLLLLPLLFLNASYRPVILVFLAIGAFEVLSLYFGMTVIFLPYLFPEESLFNVRYGLFLLPLTAIALGYVMAEKQLVAALGAGALIITQLFFSFRELPITLLEPLTVETTSLHKQAIGAAFLREQYTGGRILVIPIPNDSLILRSGFSLDEFVTDGNQEYWREALRQPEAHVEWIVRDMGVNYFSLPEESGSIEYALEHWYTLEFSHQGLLIYRRLPEATLVFQSFLP